MNDEKELISKTILLLRFPLMLGVLLIHCKVAEPTQLIDQGFTISNVLTDICSKQMTIGCVPTFFFISGYLLFIKTGSCFNTKIYVNCLRKRIKTLLIPYIFWNAAVIVAFACIHLFIPQVINPENNNIFHFNLGELFRSFWDYPGGQPICYQFWFLRDLMIMFLISPTIFLYVKYTKYIGAIGLLVLYVFDPQLFQHQFSLTFFTIGAYFSINTSSLIKTIHLLFVPSLLIYCVCVADSQTKMFGGLRELETVSAIVVYLSFALYLAKKGVTINTFLSESNFFIYAFHGLPIIIMSKILVNTISPNTDFSWMVSYLLLFVLILVLSLTVYYMTRQLCPNFLRVITGGR